MDILCSLKLYYKENKLSVFLVNLFFLSIIIIFSMPFWASDFVFDYIYKIFHFDFIVTGAFTLIFIMFYSYIMFDSIIMKGIYSVLVGLNLVYALIGIGFFMSSYKESLAIVPQLIILFSFIFIYIKFKKHKCLKQYNPNMITILISIIMPLLLLNILGRLIFSFIS